MCWVCGAVERAADDWLWLNLDWQRQRPVYAAVFEVLRSRGCRQQCILWTYKWLALTSCWDYTELWKRRKESCILLVVVAVWNCQEVRSEAVVPTWHQLIPQLQPVQWIQLMLTLSAASQPWKQIKAASGCSWFCLLVLVFLCKFNFTIILSFLW